MRNDKLVVRKNVRNSKQVLVESIMTKIAPIVKSALNENAEDEHIVTFNNRVGITVDLDGEYEEAYKKRSVNESILPINEEILENNKWIICYLPSRAFTDSTFDSIYAVRPDFINGKKRINFNMYTSKPNNFRGYNSVSQYADVTTIPQFSTIGAAKKAIEAMKERAISYNPRCDADIVSKWFDTSFIIRKFSDFSDYREHIYYVVGNVEGDMFVTKYKSLNFYSMTNIERDTKDDIYTFIDRDVAQTLASKLGDGYIVYGAADGQAKFEEMIAKHKRDVAQEISRKKQVAYQQSPLAKRRELRKNAMNVPSKWRVTINDSIGSMTMEASADTEEKAKEKVMRIYGLKYPNAEISTDNVKAIKIK